jgi:hypothetical protein
MRFLSVLYSPKSLFLLLPIMAALVVLWPVLKDGFPVAAHDTNYSLGYMLGFSKQFWAGEAYPRWITSHYSGLGGPAFFFYPPVAFYYASVLGAIPVLLADPLLWLGIASVLGIIASGYTAYFWLRTLATPHAAMAGALIYMLAPGHVFVSFYTRGAYAETLAFVFLPLVFLGFSRLSTTRLSSFIMPALSYAALIGTNLPVAVAATPIIALFCFFQTFKTKALHARMLILTGGACAGLLGLAVVAFYLVPALGMMNLIEQDRLWGQERDYKFSFMCLTACQDWRQFSMTLLFVLEATISIGLLTLAHRRGQCAHYRFWITAIIIILFLQTPFSAFIWEHSFLWTVQFPYRFIIVFELALAYAVTSAASSLSKQELRTGFVSLLSFILMSSVCMKYEYERKSASQYDIYRARAQHCIQEFCAPRDFIPPGVIVRNEMTQSLPPYEIMSGKGAITIDIVDSRNWNIDVQSNEAFTVQLRQHMYPWWEARDQNNHLIPVIASGAHGLITLDVPAGTTRIDLRLIKNQYEIAGMIISLFSMMIIILLFLSRRRKS